MRILKILLHSFILAITNLLSILVGFTIYHFIPQFNQSLIQIPVATFFSVIIFIVWVLIIRFKKIVKLIPENRIDYIFIIIVSLLWIPIIFYPLHYFTQHYITSYRNISWVWMFQIPVNVIIVFITYIVLRKIKLLLH